MNYIIHVPLNYKVILIYTLNVFFLSCSLSKLRLCCVHDKKNVYTESTNTFICQFAILFKMSKLIHLPLNLVRTDHEILFLNSKLFLKLSFI